MQRRWFQLSISLILAICLTWLLFLARATAQDPQPTDEAAAQSTDEATSHVSFKDEIATIFVRQCMACHNAEKAEGGFDLSTYESLMKGGNTGDTILPGKPDESNLLFLIEEGEMPKEADPLPPEQIALVRRWIAEDAPFDGPTPSALLTTIIPKGIHPSPPSVYRVPVPITALAFKPGGRQLAVGGYHEIMIWCRECGALARRLTNVAERTYALAWSQDGQLLASGSGTPAQLGEVKLWNPRTGEIVRDLDTTSDSVFCMAFSPDGKKLAAGGADRAIRIWDVESGNRLVEIEDHADWVMGVAWSPDGTQLASASRDKTAKVFDAATGESLMTFPDHGEPVFAVAFSPDGKLVATAGRDKQIRIWNPEDGKQARAIGGHSHEIYNVISVAEPGPAIFTTSADKTVRQFNPADGSEMRVFEGHSDYVYSAAFSPESAELATGDWGGEICIWNVTDGRLVDRFIAAPGYKEPAEVAQTK